MPNPLLVDFALAWFILFPAYTANAIPVLVRGRRPLDLGKNWRGRRILGDGKTIEGTAAGIIAGFLIGALEYYLLPALQTEASRFDVILPEITLTVAAAVAIGAIAGDIIGSFIKRRVGIERGGKAPVLDRLDFIAFAMMFSYPFVSITLWMAMFMIITTFVIHRASNFVAYKLKLKKVPW